MKKILIGLSVILLSVAGFAGDGSKVSYTSTGNAIGVTNVITTKKFYASLYSIHFDVAAGTTNSVVVASPTETILTKTVTADDTFRPWTQIDNTSGAAVTTVYEEFLLEGEPLTVTIIASDPGTNDVKVVIKTDNK